MLKKERINNIKELIIPLDQTLQDEQIKINELEDYYHKHILSLQEYLNIFIEHKNHFEEQLLGKLTVEQLNKLHDEIREWLNKAIIWKV